MFTAFCATKSRVVSHHKERFCTFKQYHPCICDNIPIPSLFQGGYAGNAAGMKISSLHKLSDIRSNKPGLNLLHYVAGQAEEAHPELLGLPDDLAVLEEAARTSLEVLKADVGKLDGQVTKIQAQLKNPNTKADVKKQMEEFLPVSGVLRFNNVASKLNHKIREKKPSPRGLRAENHSFTLIAIAAATLVFVLVSDMGESNGRARSSGAGNYQG